MIYDRPKEADAMGEAARRRRAQIEAGAQAIHSEGQGVMELGVYMIADLVALKALADQGDTEAISDRSVIGATLRDFETQGRGCFFCNGPVVRVAAVITLTAKVHQPATAGGGVVCPTCCTSQQGMRERIEADWRRGDPSLRKIDIAPAGRA